MTNSDNSYSSVDRLDKSDLYLLMESYKNMIELNRTLLEQQKQSTTQINLLTESQKILCENVNKLIIELSSNNMKIRNEHETILEAAKSNQTIAKDYYNQSIIKLDGLKSIGTTIKYNVQILWVGLSGIVISLVGLVIKVIDMIK